MNSHENNDRKSHNGLAIGIAIGIALGVALGNVGVGIALGVAIGVAMDSSAARKHNDDREQ